MYNLLAQVTGRKRVMLYSPQDTLHLNLTGDKSERLAIDCSNLGWFPEFVKAWWYSCTRTCFFQSLKCAVIVHELHQFNIVPVSPSDMWFHNTMALQFGMGVNIFWCHLPAEGYNKNDPYGKNKGVEKMLTHSCGCNRQVLNSLPKQMNQTPGSYSLGHLHTVAKHFKPMATELK
uniref:Uncharacterized protein n=1 Tax=Oncorhynchus mykiss TaxID=8022 RepID=A0A8C7T8U5_ONCMY